MVARAPWASSIITTIHVSVRRGSLERIARVSEIPDDTELLHGQLKYYYTNNNNICGCIKSYNRISACREDYNLHVKLTTNYKQGYKNLYYTSDVMG